MAKKKTNTAKKMGAPRKELNWEEFEGLCKLQCTEMEMCSYFDIDSNTLELRIKEEYNKTFSEVFKLKRGKGKISLRRKQWNLATDSPAMAIFLGKNFLGQKDKPDVEIDNDEQISKFLTKANQVTNVYLKMVEAIENGFTIINGRGGTRSSKTYSTAQLFKDFLFTGEIAGKKITGNIGFFRRTLPSLKITILKDLLQVFEDSGIEFGKDVKWHKTEKYFQRGDRYIYYGSVNSDKDAMAIRGLGLGAICLNESNEHLFDTFLQTYMRAKDKPLIFLDYNPDDKQSWVNKKIEIEYSAQLGNVATIHSTYKDNRFLSKEHVERIESFKKLNPDYWTIYGEGEYGKTVGVIYPYWRTYEELPPGDYVTVLGEDFGYANSKDALIEINWLKGTNKLYLKGLLYSTGLSTNDLISVNRQHAQGKVIYADAAEPRIIADIRREKINIFKTKKSVLTDIQRVQRFELNVHADSEDLQMEFEGYKWLKNELGEPINVPIDQDDHYMKALGYGVNGLMIHQKAKIPELKEVQ